MNICVVVWAPWIGQGRLFKIKSFLGFFFKYILKLGLDRVETASVKMANVCILAFFFFGWTRTYHCSLAINSDFRLMNSNFKHEQYFLHIKNLFYCIVFQFSTQSKCTLSLTYLSINLAKVPPHKIGLLTLTIHLFEISCIGLTPLAGPSNHRAGSVVGSFCPLQYHI